MVRRLYRVYALMPSERAACGVLERIRDRDYSVAHARILAPRDRVERGVFLQILAGGALGAAAGGLAVWVVHRAGLLAVDLSLEGIASMTALLVSLVGVALAGFVGVRVRPSHAPMEQHMAGARVGIAVTTDNPVDAKRVRDYMVSMSRAAYDEVPAWVSTVSNVEETATREAR